MRALRRTLRLAMAATFAAFWAAGPGTPVAAQVRPAPREPEPILAGVAPPAGPYAPSVDVLHYDVELGLSDREEWIAGRTRIQ